jgi:hypothetical protein|nr:MAG TPA: hypothetical protein [Herelleviridae sp.]
MNLIGNINAIPFRRFRGGGGVSPIPPFPSIPGMIARYSALGLTNEQMAENPIWVDKTGIGHDLQMKNFAWGGMSGVGGYTENYDSNKWYKAPERIDATWTYKSFNVKSIKVSNITQLFYQSKSSDTGFRVLSCTIKVSGLTDGQGIEYVSNGTQQFVIMRIENDGIYHLPSFDFGAKNAYYGFRFLKLQESCNITIEQLPLYPGALVFDGVDDYGVCDNFPILTKEKGYTVVALRQWISMGEGISGLVSNVKNWFNDGAFILEYNSNNATNKFVNRPVSFGKVNIEMDLPNNFTYQTSKSYKGVPITTDSFKGTNSLFVGKLDNIIGNCSNVAIWELVFLDHDATEEELTKIKDYFVKTYPWLFFDHAWTVVGKTNEDEDRATIANITGNGNDLVLSNFGFIEGSGYNEEGQYAGYLVTDGVDDKIESKQPFQLPIKFSMIGSWVFIKKEDKRAGISKENNLIVYDKITGLTLFLNSVESYEEIDIDSFHAISSDGKLYDENWNMLPITVGSLLSDSSTLKIAYDGNNFVQFAFNCMGFYDKILKKDDLLKGWIYLKGLKAQRIPPSKNYILKEDGGYVLQEDGNKILTEQQ